MLKEAVVGLAMVSLTNLASFVSTISSDTFPKQEEILAVKELDFDNKVFADNILLALHYRKGDVLQMKDSKGEIDWDKVRKPFETSFILKPGEAFAFHNNVLPEYKDSVSYTMNSRFFGEEGYKFLDGLGGNGVCHLASLINWTASETNLKVAAKVNHDFYPVPGVPREFGTSIFYSQNGGNNSENQNLYIKNNLQVPVTFIFEADNKHVGLKIIE